MNMLSMDEIYEITHTWCDEEFGPENVEGKTSGDNGEIRKFTIHCLGNDPDCYVDIGGYRNLGGTTISIWSHNQENVNIEIFSNGIFKWEEDARFYDFCGPDEMRRLYEFIQYHDIRDYTKKHPLQEKLDYPEEKSVEERSAVQDTKKDLDSPAVMVYDGTYFSKNSPIEYNYEFLNTMPGSIYKVTKIDLSCNAISPKVSYVVGINNGEQYLLLITDTEKFWEKYIEPRIKELNEAVENYRKYLKEENDNDI